MGDFRVDFDSDELAGEIAEEVVERIDTERLVDRIRQNGDLPTAEPDMSGVWSEAESQLDSMPHTHSGRCTLGKAFERAVVRVMASAMTVEPDERGAMDEAYPGEMSVLRAFVKREAAQVVTQGAQEWLPKPEDVESYSVLALSSDRVTVNYVYGPFATQSDAAEWAAQRLGLPHTRVMKVQPTS